MNDVEVLTKEAKDHIGRVMNYLDLMLTDLARDKDSPAGQWQEFQDNWKNGYIASAAQVVNEIPELDIHREHNAYRTAFYLVQHLNKRSGDDRTRVLFDMLNVEMIYENRVELQEQE